MGTKSLTEIAEEIKNYLGGEREINLIGNLGLISYNVLPKSAVLYEVKKDEKDNVIIGFNLLFLKTIPEGEETRESKKMRKFIDENNYILEYRYYESTFPKQEGKNSSLSQ